MLILPVRPPAVGGVTDYSEQWTKKTNKERSFCGGSRLFTWDELSSIKLETYCLRVNLFSQDLPYIKLKANSSLDETLHT